MGGGLGPKSLCTKRRPNQIFPMVNFVFSLYGHCSLGGVRGAGGGGGFLWCTAIPILPTPGPVRCTWLGMAEEKGASSSQKDRQREGVEGLDWYGNCRASIRAGASLMVAVSD